MATLDVALDKLFKKDGIDALHGTSPDEEAKRLYNRSAETYDEVSIKSGYQAHKIMVELFDKNLEKIHGTSRKETKILDVGAGTGIIGANLKEMGYTNIDAVDISQEMLNKAKEKNAYKKLICAPLCADAITEIPTGTYDAMISVAALTAGHIKPPAFDEMVRHVKTGGILCFTIRRDVYDKEDHFGYQTKMAQLEKDGKWELISKELIDYYSNVDEKRNKCYAIVYKVIKH